MGAYDQAITTAQRALALATAGGEVVLQALANRYLGVAYQSQGDYRRAIDCLGQSVASLEGGEVQPGDDMRDAQYRWWSIEELTAANIRFHPSTHLWMLQRAVGLYRCWKDQPTVRLQPDLDL